RAPDLAVPRRPNLRVESSIRPREHGTKRSQSATGGNQRMVVLALMPYSAPRRRSRSADARQTPIVARRGGGEDDHLLWGSTKRVGPSALRASLELMRLPQFRTMGEFLFAVYLIERALPAEYARQV